MSQQIISEHELVWQFVAKYRREAPHPSVALTVLRLGRPYTNRVRRDPALLVSTYWVSLLLAAQLIYLLCS